MTLTEEHSERTKMMGFDLEKARAVLEEAIDRMSLTVSDEDGFVWEADPEQTAILQEILDRIGRYTNNDYLDLQYQLDSANAEIERLQASLIDLHAEYINTLEKNPECSAWDLDEQSIEDQRRLRRNAAHAISIVEPPIYLQADQQVAKIKELKADLEQSEICIQARLDVIDQQAARIKSLKKEIRRLKHESKVEQEFTNSYIKRLHDAEARIKELEDAHKRSGAKYAKIINELRSSVYANIPGLDVGKIGPDAKPRVWQITEERIGLLEYCLETLLDAPDIEEIPGPGHSIEVLRAMLREAGQ